MRDIAELMMHMRCVVHFLWCFLYFVWWKSVFAWWKDFWICLKRFLDLLGPDLQPSWWRVRCNVDSWQRCTTSSSNDARSGRSRERCEKAADVKLMEICISLKGCLYLLESITHLLRHKYKWEIMSCKNPLKVYLYLLRPKCKCEFMSWDWLGFSSEYFCICLKSFESIFVVVEPKCKCEMMSCD